MKYEIVELSEKKVEGITVKTNNNDPKMVEQIGGLWQRFYTEGGPVEQISEPTNDCAIGLYDNYESDLWGDYEATVGREVNDFGKAGGELTQKIIPAGKYAKFVVQGHVQIAVTAFWEEFIASNIDQQITRAYTADFEEYQSNKSMDNCMIYIYISVK